MSAKKAVGSFVAHHSSHDETTGRDDDHKNTEKTKKLHSFSQKTKMPPHHYLILKPAN